MPRVTTPKKPARLTKKPKHEPTAAVSSSVDPSPPLECELAPGWDRLLDALSQLSATAPSDDEVLAATSAAGLRHAHLGASLLRALNGTFRLHQTLERAGMVAAQSAAEAREQLHTVERLGRVDPLPTAWLGEELSELPIYSRVMATNQVAARKVLDALAAVDRAATDGSAGETGGREETWRGWEVPNGEPAVSRDSGGDAEDDARVLAAARRVSSLPAHAEMDEAARTRFRDLYMELLTEAAASDLEQLRQAHMTPRQLGVLVDALEAGAETFDAPQRQLAMQSYSGGGCWWLSSGNVASARSARRAVVVAPAVAEASRAHGGVFDEADGPLHASKPTPPPTFSTNGSSPSLPLLDACNGSSPALPLLDAWRREHRVRDPLVSRQPHR